MESLQHVFNFLSLLKINNSREWFAKNKLMFQKSEQQVVQLSCLLREQMTNFDKIEKVKVFRIYKDVRFSKDKSPYKTNRGIHFTREGVYRRGGYYLQLEPKNSFIAAGFFEPNAVDLLRFRKEFERDSTYILSIFNQKDFKYLFNGFDSYNKLKSAPRGFDKNHPNIDLIKNKSFFVSHSYTDEEVLSEAFINNVTTHCKLLIPFLDYMSDVVTTDLNGVSLV